jgi:hypothetical protein
VKTVGSIGPELYAVGMNPEAAPVCGTGNLTGVSICEDARPFFELASAGKGTALVGDRRADLTFARAAMEVRVYLIRAEFGDMALDAYLAAKVLPMEAECSDGILGELAAFLAFDVCEEAESVVAQSLDKNHTDAGQTARRGGCECSGVGVIWLARSGLLEPGVKKWERVIEWNFIFAAAGCAAHGLILGAGVAKSLRTEVLVSMGR